MVRKNQNYDWEKETHTIRIFKILGNPLKEDFDPIASFFGSAEEEAMKFVKEYVETYPDHHIFADRIANEPYTLLFDSKPEVTEAALKAFEDGSAVEEDEPSESDYVPAYVRPVVARPHRVNRRPSVPRADKKKALEEWLQRGKKNSGQ
jgi:hypothetical protein